MKPGPIKLERLYSAQEAQAEVFTCRSLRWIKDKAKAGAFGPVVMEANRVMIPASGIQSWLDQHTVGAIQVPRFYAIPQ